MSGIPLPKSALAGFDALLSSAPAGAILGMSAPDAGQKATERTIGEPAQKQGFRMAAPGSKLS